MAKDYDVFNTMLQAAESDKTFVDIPPSINPEMQSYSDFIDKLDILNVNPPTDKEYAEHKNKLSTLWEDVQAGKMTPDEAMDLMDMTTTLHHRKDIKSRNITDLIKLTNIWNKAKQPAVKYGSNLFTEIARGRPTATYNPLSHSLNLPAGENYSGEKRDDLIDQFLAEVSHGLSFTDVGSEGHEERKSKQEEYQFGFIVDFLTKILPEDYETRLYEKSYSDPEAEEYYAHSVIQPLLDEYMNKANIKPLDELLEVLKGD